MIHTTAIATGIALDQLLSREVLAPIGAVAGAIVLYYWLGTRYLGPDDDWWNPLRRAVLPLLDRVFARAFGGYAVGRSHAAGYVGRVDAGVDELEATLATHGFEKNPWAALKRSPDGRLEARSLALRQVTNPIVRKALDALEAWPLAGDVFELVEALVATRQIHVTLYDVSGGGVDVYAHEEANSVNPFTALEHYDGVGMDRERAVEWVRERFDRWGVRYSRS